jgi:hypothetical protein
MPVPVLVGALVAVSFGWDRRDRSEGHKRNNKDMSEAFHDFEMELEECESVQERMLQ